MQLKMGLQVLRAIVKLRKEPQGLLTKTKVHSVVWLSAVGLLSIIISGIYFNKVKSLIGLLLNFESFKSTFYESVSENLEKHF